MTTKYVPPHRRNSLSSPTSDATKDHVEIKEEGEITPFNQPKSGSDVWPFRQSFTRTKRRANSSAPSFNTLTDQEISGRNLSSVLSSIVIPEAVDPVIVDSPINAKIVYSLAYGLSDMRKEANRRELDSWSQHYEKELFNMYTRFIDPELEVPYHKFVEAAHKCTETRYDSKLLKRIRPLV